MVRSSLGRILPRSARFHQTGQSIPYMAKTQLLEFGPPQISKCRFDGLDPEMLTSIAPERDSSGDRARCLRDAAAAETAGIKLHFVTGIVARDLPNVMQMVGAEVSQKDVSGPPRTVPFIPATVSEVHLVGDEVAERICDGGAVPGLQALEDVGMMAKDHRGARVDECTGLFDLNGRGDQKPLFAPVNRDEHVIDLRTESPNLRDQKIDVEGNHARLVGLCELLHSAPFVDGPEEGQAHAVDLQEDGSRGFVKVQPGAEVREIELCKQISELLKPGFETVEGVVVGQRDDREARGLDGPDQLGRADYPRFRGHASAVAGKGALQVAEHHVALGKNGPHFRRDQRRVARVRTPLRVRRDQQVADSGEANDSFG